MTRKEVRFINIEIIFEIIAILMIIESIIVILPKKDNPYKLK